MHRLLPLRARPLWSRARPLQSLSLASSWHRKLICCVQTCNPCVFSRPLLTSTPLYRQPRAEEEKEEEAEEDDEDDEPLPHRPTSDSTTLPLKYLLRSDFFSSLLLTTYPNLTLLQYRTHLSAFIKTNRHNQHLHHLVQQLIVGDDPQNPPEAGGGRKRRKHSKRNRRVKLAREIAYIYARFVRDETGEIRVAERQRVRGGRGKGTAAVEDGDEMEEDEEDEVEEGEDGRRAEGDRSSVSDGRRVHRGHSRADPFEEQSGSVDEDEEGQQRGQQRSPLHSSSFLRGKGGRLRYDPSLAFLADLSQPHQTYPLARSLNRKIILHTGPTNSGKTHAAMQALQSAGSGVYAAPLRLLAWEQYDRMTKRGVKAELITGRNSWPTETMMPITDDTTTRHRTQTQFVVLCSLSLLRFFAALFRPGASDIRRRHTYQLDHRNGFYGSTVRRSCRRRGADDRK